MGFTDLEGSPRTAGRRPSVPRACDVAWAFADLVRHQRGYLKLEGIRPAEQDAPKPMSKSPARRRSAWQAK
jgi:hypothetical protein